MTGNVPSGNIQCGLVLMGGQSHRMGQDKSGLAYHGKPQRDHLTDLLSPFCDRVIWSVNEPQHATLTYPDRLLDLYPQSGPLGGILTAFATYPDAAFLVVPCDLPLLDEKTISTLMAGRNRAAPATAFWDGDHCGPEPLVSVWEPAAGPLLRSYFGQGHRSPRQFLRQHGAHLLNAPDVNAFRNANTPQDASTARLRRMRESSDGKNRFR